MQGEIDDYDLRVDNRPKTLRELTLEKLRGAIITGRFQPGERLVERSLCDRLGVSRSVVREVVRYLESEGLVESIPHQGPIVARIDAASAAEIYEIRALLEASAAEACAKKAGPEEISELEKALDAIDEAYAAKDIRRVLDATTRFYEVLFMAGGKAVSWDVVRRLNGRISRLRVLTISSHGRNVTGPAQMRAIFDAISAHDPKKAREACARHLRQAAAIAAEMLVAEEAADLQG